MKCPVCEVEMRITQRESIEIDYCPQCRGVWLDRGELEKIVARVEGQDSRGRERDDDDDHDDHDDDEGSRYRDRRPEHGSGRNDHYRQDRPYRGDDRAHYGKQKREGFLSNLFEMFGGD